jgi:hypothetical protein
MRIPTSVIVMSLVTAAPFALAVRDTLHPQPKHHAYDDDEIDVEAESARYEAEMQREQEEERAEAARKRVVLQGLLGEKGKLGPYVDNLTLGATREQIEALNDRIASATDLVYIGADYDVHDQATSLQVVFTDCSALRDAVRTEWGEANQWLDSASHVKTTFEDGYDCSLSLHRYVEIEQFLDKTLTASIPLAALGKPTAKLPLDGDLAMTTPGLETTADVMVRATAGDHGEVIGLGAVFAADVEADAPIRARLDKLLGKGTQDPDTGEWQWKGKIPVHYSYSDAHVYIDIGEP